MNTKKKLATPKYIYAATLRETGKLVTRADDDTPVVDFDSYGALEQGLDAVPVPKNGDAVKVKVVRYVLESSVRPGGRP